MSGSSALAVDTATGAAAEAIDAVYRVDVPGASRRVAAWRGVQAQLLTLDRTAICEWEFRLASLVVMTDLAGNSGSCQWTDGGEMRKLAALPPLSVVCNPANHYLWIRRRMPRGARLLLLTVDPGELETLSDDFPPSQLQFSQRVDLTDTFLHRMLQAIAEEIESEGPGGRLHRRALTLLLMSQLVRCASTLARPARHAPATGGLPSWRLKRALAIFDSQLTEKPSLAELARQIGLHPTSFSRGFKQSTGVSPHRYLLQRRVELAKAMMADQALSLTQIALACGFCSSSQFSVVFRRVTGQTPSAYRRSL